MTEWEVVLVDTSVSNVLEPKLSVGPYSTSEEPSSPVVQVIVAESVDAVPEDTAEITGAVVSTVRVPAVVSEPSFPAVSMALTKKL